ncbi:MAG TPA: hypothetical protein VI299_17195 [Polyangiales bacterium]
MSLAIAGAADNARAYDEQWSLDGALGYALLVRDDWPTRQGAGVDLGASIGLGDTVVMRGSLGYALLSDGSRREQIGRLRAEGIYLLDVLQLVPFLGAGVTLTTAQHSDAQVPLRPGVHLVLGLDYLWSRTWTLGLDVRSGVLFEAGHPLNATDVSLRMSRTFEMF